MQTPGSVLKTEREKQKRTLEAISGNLRIKIEFLRAIEDDDYEKLPAAVFTKAYLKLYSEALGLDSNYVLGLYKPEEEVETVETPLPPKENVIITRLKDISLPGFKPLITVAVLLMIILSAVLVIKYRGQKTPETDVSATKEEEVTAQIKTEALSLNIEAVELTWVSVRIDDGKPEEWLLRPGEVVSVTAADKFAVKIGNAGGTRILFNGKDIGKLGKRGKVVDIVLP